MAASGGAARPVTQFKEGRVLWPSASADGKLIVFERDFGIWTLNTENGLAQPVRIQQRGAPASPGRGAAALHRPLAGAGALARWQESGLHRARRGIRRLGRRRRRRHPPHHHHGRRNRPGLGARQPPAGVRLGPRRR
ncbi:MAG: hypothetical protein WKG07_26310 [Hymenobacter sp.]